MKTIQAVRVVNVRDFLPAYQVTTEEGPMTRLPDAAYAVGVTMSDGTAFLHEARFDHTSAGRDAVDRLWARVHAARQINLAHWEQLA